MFCLSMFRISIGVLIPETALTFSLSEVEVSIVLSAYLVAMALVMGLSGFISDKLGKKLIMALGLLMVSVGVFIGSFSHTFNLIVASTFIAGLGAGFYTPALYAYIGEVLPSSKGFLTGLTNSVYAFGGFFGPLIFSLITEKYNWRMAMLFLAFLSLISFIVIWLIPCDKSVFKQKAIPYKSILMDKNIALITIALTIANAGFVVFTAWTPKFLMELENFSVVEAGLSFGLCSFFGGLGAIIFGKLSDKFNRCGVNALVSGASAFLAFFYYLNLRYGFFSRIIFSIILGLVLYAYWSLSTAAAQDFVNSSFFGSVTGFVQNMAVLSAAAAPTLSGILSSYLGLSYALIISIALLYLIHSLIFLILFFKKVEIMKNLINNKLLL
ncbi:MAG: MFS transporter [Candidatus Bathyarchaeia archaeon]